MNLRIAMIAPFAEHPKATTTARTIPLARALAKRGHTVSVIVPPYDNPVEGGRTTYRQGVVIHSLPVSTSHREASPMQAIAQPLLAVRATIAALLFKPDIVHLFKPKAVSGLTHAAFAMLRGIPRNRRPALIVDTDDWEGDGGWNEYERYPRWQRIIVNVQERWGISQADAVTAASRTLTMQARDFGQRPERIVHLPNGVDDEDYPEWWPSDGTSRNRDADREALLRRFALPDVPICVLYTRGFEFAPARALATIVEIRRTYPDAVLLVVGAGKFGQERELARLAQTSGNEQAVVLAGWQERDALPALLGGADVAIALADDNLANRAKCSVKLLQLLRLGIPVVADATGEQARYIENGISGLLVRPADVGAMATAVVELLDNDARRTAIGEAAINRARSHFSWDILAPTAENLYREALSRTGRGVRS